MRTQALVPLTEEQLRAQVPAAFGQCPAKHMSQRYHFVDSAAVIAELRSGGWLPVAAAQKRDREVAKHLIRFRHQALTGVLPGDADAVGQGYPELVMVNSHNGRSRFELMAGVFVVACCNGLIVARESLGAVSLVHVRGHEDAMLAAAEQIVELMQPIMHRIRGMRERQLSLSEQESFAQEALAAHYGARTPPFTPDQILAPRRAADARPDLWATFGRVQENLMAGGIVGRTRGKVARMFTSRPVRDISTQVGTNQALWLLADRYLDQK